MRRLVSVALVVMFSSGAYADGVPEPYSAPVTLQTSQWAGFYAGLHVGRAWSDFQTIDSSQNKNCWWCVNNYGDDAESFFGGGQLGYNFQRANIVFGVEGDIGGGLLGGSALDPTNVGPSSRVDGDFYATITGRLGYAFGPALLYGKAGWGWVDTDFDWSDPVYSAHASAHETLEGAVFGGGLEYLLSPRLSVKAEYLRFNVSDSKVLDVQGYCCGYQQPIEVDDIDTFKLGINIHLQADRSHVEALK